MSNYSILQQNTLYGLSETAGILYLRLCDQYRDEKQAFFEACKYEQGFGGVVDHVLNNYHEVCHVHKEDDWPDTKRKLSAFFSERWRNNFICQQKP